MVTVDTVFSDMIEIKGSKFIAFLMPISMFESEMKRLREAHPKAVHWVSAYRNLNEYDQILEHSSDDGEPKGTSGKPTLSVLQGHDLINAAVITVRYFGGTKLGPGGLVRAYAEAANAAMNVAELISYEKTYQEKIRCDYANISIVEYELPKNRIAAIAKAFDESGAVFHLQGTREDLDQLYEILGRSIVQVSTTQS